MKALMMIAVVASAALGANAQDAGSHQGSWAVKWTGASGTPREAHVELTGSTGTWKMLVTSQRGRPDPCDTVVHPATVESATATELVILVDRSKGLAGCRSTKLTLEKQGDGSFTGKFGGGTPLTMTRR